LSDRSQHFVFSTMKNLNKEAIMSLDRNLLHQKLLEKQQKHLSLKHTQAIKPLAEQVYHPEMEAK
jgi:hypothetical protein